MIIYVFKKNYALSKNIKAIKLFFALRLYLFFFVVKRFEDGKSEDLYRRVEGKRKFIWENL